MPVSVIVIPVIIVFPCFPSLVIFIFIFPFDVNFSELPIRFTKICVSLVASPSKVSGKESSTSAVSCTSFSFAFVLNIVSTE